MTYGTIRDKRNGHCDIGGTDCLERPRRDIPEPLGRYGSPPLPVYNFDHARRNKPTLPNTNKPFEVSTGLDRVLVRMFLVCLNNQLYEIMTHDILFSEVNQLDPFNT